MRWRSQVHTGIFYFQYSTCAAESDAPFGGVSVLGEANTPVPLIFQRIPIAWTQSSATETIFSGVVEDGAYDYRIYYTLSVRQLVE